MGKLKFLFMAIIAITVCSCGNKNEIELSPDNTMSFSPISEFVELNEDSDIILTKDSIESETFNVTLRLTLNVKKQSEIISPDVTFVIADGDKVVMDKYSFRLGEWNSENTNALSDAVAKGNGQLSLTLSTQDSCVGKKLTTEDWETIKSKGKYVIILTSSFNKYDKSIDDQILTLKKDVDNYIENIDANAVDQFSTYNQSYERLAATMRRMQDAKPRMAKTQLTSYETEINRLIEAAKKLQ